MLIGVIYNFPIGFCPCLFDICDIWPVSPISPMHCFYRPMFVVLVQCYCVFALIKYSCCVPLLPCIMA